VNLQDTDPPKISTRPWRESRVSEHECGGCSPCYDLLSPLELTLAFLGGAVTRALLIALITLLGFATAFVGLGLLMPWLAYSAWHSYRETLDCSLWPRLHAIHDDAPLRERE
jgi:hypothetical protein